VRSVSAAIRNERATTQTDPFQANPEGRWRFGLPPGGRQTRSSRTDQNMLVATALKIGQIADGGMPPTYETMH
jgi:hypothetical protein